MAQVDGTPDSGWGQPSMYNRGAAAGEHPLAARLSELARTLHQQEDTEDTLTEIVHAATKLIPGAEEGSVSVVLDHQKVSPHAASGDLPHQVDAAQQDTGEGPCLEAVYEHKTVRVPDMRHEDRWPSFARRALEAGAESMLAFQLYVKGDNLGALNLYARRPEAFDDESEHVGLLFGAHAAVAYAETQKAEQLLHAMETRDLIGQAKGMLMERYSISGQQAFNLLIRISQSTNTKLRDIAQELIDRRELTGYER